MARAEFHHGYGSGIFARLESREDRMEPGPGSGDRGLAPGDRAAGIGATRTGNRPQRTGQQGSGIGPQGTGQQGSGAEDRPPGIGHNGLGSGARPGQPGGPIEKGNQRQRINKATLPQRNSRVARRIVRGVSARYRFIVCAVSYSWTIPRRYVQE